MIGAHEARIAWGCLALLSGACSVAGLVAAASALRVARERYRYGGLAARLVSARDIWMLGLLALSSALGIGTAGLLLALLRWYGPDLDPVLAALAVPVLMAYAGYAAQVGLVGAVAPIWIIARWRAMLRPKRGGIE